MLICIFNERCHIHRIRGGNKIEHFAEKYGVAVETALLGKTKDEEIAAYLKEKKKALFTELFTEYNKSYIVVTFMSILELAKEEEITLKQEENFDQIYIELKVK